jgi:RimJ/RimL family protein N-acetyltransferase
MGHPYWPLFDLRIWTPSVEIRYPDDDMVVGLARLAARGVHDPATMPFGTPWTDLPSPEMERDVLKHLWGKRSTWKPQDWSFPGAVLVDGEPVGVQELSAKDFSVLRTVDTGSWLGRSFHGRGIGTEMRAAILHLAFAGLGAVEAHSSAWDDNAASDAVSRKLGYVDNGVRWYKRRDAPARSLLYRLDRHTWEAHRHPDIVIEGLEPCLEWFGAADSS